MERGCVGEGEETAAGVGSAEEGAGGEMVEDEEEELWGVLVEARGGKNGGAGAPSGRASSEIGDDMTVTG